MSASRTPKKPRIPKHEKNGTVRQVQYKPEPAAMEFTQASAFATTRERTFLWPGHVLNGSLTVIEGPKGCGKSSLLAALAADCTGGPRLAAGQPARTARPVIWFAGEEDPVLDVRPKLLAAGADLQHVVFPGRDKTGKHIRHLSLPGDASLLADLARKLNAGLLILDPWSSCLPAGASTSDPVTTRQTMEVLAHIGQGSSAAVVITRNFRKDTSGGALASGLGSSEVSNVARAVIQLRPHPDQHRQHVCCVAACNAFSPPLPRAYKLIPKDGSVKIEWGTSMDLTADQLAEGDVSSVGRDERRDALSILGPVLNGRWVPVKDLLDEARRAGVCERSLRAAKAEHRIPSRRVDETGHVHYEWGPPPKDEPPTQ